MKRTLLLLLLALSWEPVAQDPETAPGERLAARMRDSGLWESPRIRGTLNIRPRRGEPLAREILLGSRPAGTGWRTTIRATLEDGKFLHLRIVHPPGGPPRYHLAESEDDRVRAERELSPQEIMQPFAGSDFWPADLGLHFFHWPVQTLQVDARIWMRKGIACHVLESRMDPEADHGYTRVRSWISRDHGGLVYAEARDREGRRVKTFEVSDIEKVEGEWRVRELRIRDDRIRSTTRLEIREDPPAD